MFYKFLIIAILSASCSSARCPHPTCKTEKICTFAAEAKRLDGLLLAHVKIEEDTRLLLFTSYKHVDIHEARRMIMTLSYHFQNFLKLPKDLKIILGIQYLEEDQSYIAGHVAEVTLRDNLVRFYIWDEEKGKRVLYHKEEAEGAFGRAYGYDFEEGYSPFMKY